MHRTHAEDKIKLIPRKILFGNPKLTSPRLSPDGKRIAYLAPNEGVLNIWIKTIGEEDDHGGPLAGGADVFAGLN